MSKRRRFSAKFKREAVAMTKVKGATIRQVANDLGIGENVLGRWKRELKQYGDKAYVGQGQARD
jgi:transposase-like protein